MFYNASVWGETTQKVCTMVDEKNSTPEKNNKKKNIIKNVFGTIGIVGILYLCYICGKIEDEVYWELHRYQFIENQKEQDTLQEAYQKKQKQIQQYRDSLTNVRKK